jgi:arylformamidase
VIPDEIGLTRRALLAGTAVAATAACGLAGPMSFLNEDPRRWAPNMEHVLRRYTLNSEAVRARLGRPRTISYGRTEAETLDLYPTRQPKAPVMIFLHGGAWRLGHARDYAFPAEMFVRAGAHFVAPDFATVTQVGLPGMVDQVRRAVTWVHRNAASFGGDPRRLHVTGHSSGGHLVGNVLVTDWAGDGLPVDVIRGALCVSGMYDLHTARLAGHTGNLTLDERSEHELSPQRHLARLTCPVIVAYASLDPPGLQEQSRAFAEAVKQAGKPASLIVGRGYNHFEIIETLANPYGLLGRAALEQMALA